MTAPPRSCAGKPARLAVRPDPLQMRLASDWLVEHCRGAGMPEAAIGRLDLCLQELLANQLEHGQGSEEPVSLELRFAGDASCRRALLTLRDHGAPFDPLSHRPEDRPKSLQETTPGGLGLVLVRKVSDAVEYQRTSSANVLTITMNWSDHD